MILTKQILEKGKSCRGAWNSQQLKCLGLSYPYKKGWKKKLVGMEIPETEVKKFLLYTDTHFDKRIIPNHSNYSLEELMSTPEKPTKKILRKRQKFLTKRATPSELIFQQRLLDFGVRFRFQVVLGFYIADFVIPEKMLIVELDGSIHLGRENEDEKRTKWLNSFGFEVLRIKNSKVETFNISTILEFPDKGGFSNAQMHANIARNNMVKTPIWKTTRGIKVIKKG